jgi:hypothetical protein
MSKIAIFAHYDNKNIIDDYVIFYLQQVKKICSTIIFVSDCDLPINELHKISNIATETIAERHGKYDFGSYQLGFWLLQNKYQNLLVMATDLLLINDSCYCLGDVSVILNSQADAVGMTDCGHVSYHLQSYFLLLKPTIFRQQFFVDFICSIEARSNKNDIILFYEIGLSQLILQHNLAIEAVFGMQKISQFINNNRKTIIKSLLQTLHPVQLIFSFYRICRSIFYKQINMVVFNNCFLILLLMKFPLIKKNLIKKNNKSFSLLIDSSSLYHRWQRILKFCNYDKNIIQKISNSI